MSVVVCRGYSGSVKGETSPGSNDWTGWGDDWVGGTAEPENSSPVEEKQWGDWGDEFSDNSKKTQKSKASKQKENAQEQKSTSSPKGNLIDFDNGDVVAVSSNAVTKTSETDSDWNNDTWANVEEDDEWQSLEIDSAKSRGNKAD